MAIYFVERKKDDFVLQLFISEWRKNKGQNTAIESCRRLVEENPEKKICMCSEFSKV